MVSDFALLAVRDFVARNSRETLLFPYARKSMPYELAAKLAGRQTLVHTGFKRIRAIATEPVLTLPKGA